MPKRRGPVGITDSHKTAMSRGRTEGRIVAEYLEALRSNKPKQGRRRTGESINSRLVQIEAELPLASVVDELLLIQERRDLQAALTNVADAPDIAGAEAKFVEVAKSYSDRKGISYASWRDVGVSAAVLKAAGVTR